MSATSKITANEATPDRTGLRNAFSTFATGVTIITSSSVGARVGVTVNSFSSLSLDPPLVLWSLSRKSASLPTFREAEHFAVHVLAADQSDISTRFAKSGGEKFEGVSWRLSTKGIPLIQDVAAVFECRRVAEYDGGDHVIFLGEVEEYTTQPHEVLLFAKGRYSLVIEHQTVPADGDSGAGAGIEAFIMPALLEAYRKLSHDFAARGRPTELDVAESRVVVALLGGNGRSPDDLAPATLLTDTRVHETLRVLESKGLIATDNKRLVHLTERGRQQAVLFLSALKEFETEKLSCLSPDKIEAARSVLSALRRAGPV